MTRPDDAFAAAQRRRFTRENAHLWIGPDAKLFMQPAAYERWVAEREAKAAEHAPDAVLEAQCKAEHRALLQLKAEVAALRAELEFRKLLRKLHHWLTQLRVPAGSPDSGQWTNGDGGGAGRIVLAQYGGTITDAFGEPYYRPGGHHEAAKAVYTRWKLRPETRAVFDRATTGRIPPIVLRTTPDGEPIGHFWKGPGGGPHGRYNQAIEELGRDFMKRHKITEEQMTPDHARAFLREIRESKDLRIRDYNNMLRLIRRLYRLRVGRGTE